MKTPEWLKPALYGAVAGAAVLAVAGFSWGGWVTGATAAKLASNQARLEVVAALVPICVEQSRQDPRLTATLADLQAATSYKRRDMLMEAGWATMPGSSEPNRNVASACMDELAAQF